MALPQESQGLFEAHRIKVHYTGVGKIKSTYAALKALEYHRPDWVLNLGTAGSQKIETGQTVECIRFVQRDSLFAENTGHFSQVFFNSSPITSLQAVTCGTADFIESGAPKVDCDIFDMEAYALAYVCDQMKVRFNSIKFVTDSSDENVVTDWKKNLKAASAALLAEYKKLTEQERLL